MGLLDNLMLSSNANYGGQNAGLLDMLRTFQMQQSQYQPSAGFAAEPNQPSPLDAAQYPAGPIVAPSSAMAQAPAGQNPIAVGDYQMPRIGDPQQFAGDPAALPQNAQPTQGQLPPQQPMQVPSLAAPTPGIGDRLMAGLQGFAHAGGILPALADGITGFATGQRSDKLGMAQQSANLTARALLAKGIDPAAVQAAITNPELMKTLVTQAYGPNKFQHITKTDAFGAQTPGSFDPATGKSTFDDGAASSAGVGGFLAPGVKAMDSTLTGKDYLAQFSPEIQAAVTNYIDGKSTPTGNPRKGFTQTVKMIAQKYGADIGQPADDVNYSARRTMRNQLSSSAPSTLGGQINIGNTAAGHLADLTQRALDLDNSNGYGIPTIAHGINEVRGFLSTEQSAKMEALKGAAQHYGQEITKFYAGSPGGVAERDRFIESVNGAKSPKELAAILSTEGELMRSRLDALGGQIKGVLGDEGVKQYPVLRPDGQAALARVEENVAKLRGQTSNPSAPAAPATPAAASASAPDRSAIEAEMKRRGLL